MTLMSRLAAWLSKLPPAETYEVDVPPLPLLHKETPQIRTGQVGMH